MTMPDPSDDALMADYLSGDIAAARALTVRHAPRVLSVAKRMLGDAAEAEDVTQEAMLKLWQIAPDWEPGRARVSTWLYRVASNLCLDRLRKRRRLAPIDEAGDPADPAEGPADRMMSRDRERALAHALARLPERQRLAVVLRHIEGLSNPEIADAMDASVEAVESLAARGRAHLARHLAGRKEDLGYGA